MLIRGQQEAVDALVRELTPHFHAPVRRMTWDALRRLPTSSGTLILDRVETLDLQQQEALLWWLGELSHTTIQVVALTSAALYSHVQAGTFLNALYYRLNVIYLEVGAASSRL